MKTLIHWLPVLALTLAAQAADTRLYEMRTYYAAPGKFEAMNARFRQHACRLFERHGIVNIGYWTPLDEKDGAGNKLVYVVAHPDREAREKAWKSFMADPDWQAAYKASEVGGKLVEKADVDFFQATDYSPVPVATEGPGPRVFELRTYTAAPGRLDALNARFRNHTVALFEKHGIHNLVYWVREGEKGAGETLAYFVTHASREAAAESFKKFGADPAWQQARKESEEKAGGGLTVAGGVKSVFLKATDYSPLQ